MSHDEKADTPEGNIAHYKGNTLQFLFNWLSWNQGIRQKNSVHLDEIRFNLGRLVVLTSGKPEARQAAEDLQKLLDGYINFPNKDKWANLKSTADKIK